MNIINCIIIEDQLAAQRILKKYIENVSNLNLVATFISPLEAISTINNEKIDLIFLDIHLPKISGIQFLNTVSNLPEVILTTAFSEYAVESFELNVLDYLLKPFSFQRFLKAISKVEITSKQPQQNLIFIKSNKGIQKLKIDAIEYVEAKGDFVLVHTKTNKHIVNSSLQDILKKLGQSFIQNHKSYIVNITNIDAINGNSLKINAKIIPIGRLYKQALLTSLKII